MEMQLFRRVNNQVNAGIRYKTDLEQYGVIEYWTFEPKSGYGDCEDYALTKLKRLITAGVPRHRMGIAKVWANFNGYREGHAVLLIDNKWVLDNVTNQIRDIKYTQYKIVNVVR